MTKRTKGEQKAYLDGYEMCANCIKKYLSAEGKQKLECLLMAVRNAVEIKDVEVIPTEKASCDNFLSKEERLKILMKTGEFDFLKDISPDKIWKLFFMLEFIGDAEREEGE